jgi:hypothetical protein
MLDLDGLERESYARGRYDGLFQAIRLVAEITGPMKPADFSDTTWKMLCKINADLNYAAADAAGAVAECS